MSRLIGKRAKADAICPTCGLEVGGYAIGITRAGRTTWDRPSKLEIGPSGVAVRVGGLTHVEGGERCLSALAHGRATARPGVALASSPAPDGRCAPDGAVADGGLGGRKLLAALPLLDGPAVDAEQLGDLAQPDYLQRRHDSTVSLVVAPVQQCRRNPLPNVVGPCKVGA